MAGNDSQSKVLDGRNWQDSSPPGVNGELMSSHIFGLKDSWTRDCLKEVS